MVITIIILLVFSLRNTDGTVIQGATHLTTFKCELRSTLSMFLCVNLAKLKTYTFFHMTLERLISYDLVTNSLFGDANP
jgi:hypothetical protein